MAPDVKTQKFAVGDDVVYPFQGVGRIKRIEMQKIRDTEMDFYVIEIPASDMIISVPVTGTDSLGIRAIVGKEEAKKAFEHLSDKVEHQNTDWKTRQQENQNLVRKGDILSIVSVVRSLHHRSLEKELPVQERKLYDSALRLLSDELALAFGHDSKEVEKSIISKMEK